MRLILIVFVLALLMGCFNPVQNPIESLSLEEIHDQISLSETKQILYTLAADSMKGRDTKNGGFEKAADFVTSYFESNNIRPFYPSYRDSLQIDGVISYNLVGQIGDFDPTKKTVLLGAHLDHIGINPQKGDSIYNGANDNAAGTTAVLQISRFLASYDWDQNILIALFAEEEKGLKGAYHLAERMKNDHINLNYMVNFEMIGTVLTSGTNQVYITGFERSNMAEVMNSIVPNFVQFLPEAKEFNLFKRSDNYAFYEKMNIPAQTLSSFDFKNFDYYHQAGDEPHQLDIENMNQIVRTAAFILAKMIHQKDTIEGYPEFE